MPPLSDAQRRPLTALRDALRRGGIDEPAPAPDTTEAVAPWASAVEAAWKKALSAAQDKLREAESAIAAAPRVAAGATSPEEAGWRRLEEACRRVEQELRAPATLRARLDEGRRSMMPKLEHATREKLVPIILEGDGSIRAELDPSGVGSLQSDLPGWINAWTEYAYRWYDTDFDRLMDDAWNPRDGALPVARPYFQELELPKLSVDIRFPVIRVQREQLGTFEGIFKHGRQGAMMLLGTAGLLGLRGSMTSTSNPDGGLGLGALLLPAALCVALYIGWSQAAAERDKQRETMENDIRTRADQSTRDMLRVWLDRQTDKLNEDARGKLQVRRAAFVQWYRDTVVPAQERSRAVAQRAAEEVERHRRDLPRLQERVRELTRVEEALRAVRALA